MVNLFNGVIRPYNSYPVFWKYWMYYVNPTTWWLRGILSSILPSVTVDCAPHEITYFDPPPGQTCSSYGGNFVNNIAKVGYLTNPGATSNCGYCAYSDGTQYMQTLNVHVGDKWRSLGIFLAFVIINWGLVYFFIYTVHVRGWTFGMSTVFGLLGKAVDGVKHVCSALLFGSSRKQASLSAVAAAANTTTNNNDHQKYGDKAISDEERGGVVN
jgi:ATP-binding cassette, subfamily G (WHITE), member 2, SNQ2